MQPSKPLRFRVIPVEQGLTLRNLLSRRVRELSREQCTELIRRGGVYVNRLRIRLPQVVVAPGERITVYRSALDVEPLAPDSLVFVHREPDFVVLDKPAGVPVTATRECAIGSLGEALVARLEREGTKRPYVGVVHRLDRGASGLVLFTTRSVANKSLHQQFREHRIRRTYRLRTLALDPSKPVPTAITVDTPLVRLRGGGVELGVPGSANAIPAVTHLRHLAAIAGEHLWEAELETGRTHQIRAHVASLGFPIVGDHRYGPGPGEERESPDGEDEALVDGESGEGEAEGRILLHAGQLELVHPANGGVVAIAAKLPEWALAP
jgi:23S rRNA pseudouridine1911/1915/1917 synthase